MMQKTKEKLEKEIRVKAAIDKQKRGTLEEPLGFTENLKLQA